jgi:plasmid replication initiation protein
MSMRRKQTSEREQLDLFRALPGDLAPRDAQDLMAYPFFSLAKSRRTVPIDFRAGKITIRVEAVPEHGMATIWDADVLIWAASQIVEARDGGLKTSRLMAATPYEILTFVQDGSRHPEEVAACRRRLHTAARSFEYSHLDACFQLTNTAAEGGLPKQQGLGRPPKAAVIRGRHGISEMH